MNTHDEFNVEKLDRAMRGWTNGSKYVLAHILTPPEIRMKANFVGTNSELLTWVKEFPYQVGSVWVASNQSLVDTMKSKRPELEIYQVPIDC